MMRIAENFARNDTGLHSPSTYDKLYRTTISDDLLAAATVGDTVYISVLLEVRESIPSLRIYDTNGSKALSIGMRILRDIPQGLAWYTVQTTVIEGNDKPLWVLDIWDTTTGVGEGYDMDLLQVIVSLSPSDIWLPSESDLTPKQVAFLPPYGEYREIKNL